MVREALRDRLGLRSRYRGTFDRYGLKSAYKGLPPVTLCLTDVKAVPSEKPITDHLWFNETRGFQRLGPLRPGDIVAFDGRVTPYEKGYVSSRDEVDLRETDYRLSHPTRVTLLSRAAEHSYEVCPRCRYPNPEHAEACRRCGYRFMPLPPEPQAKEYTQTTLVPSSR